MASAKLGCSGMAQEEGLALTPLWAASRAPSRDVSEAGHLRGHRELAESPREAGGAGEEEGVCGRACGGRDSRPCTVLKGSPADEAWGPWREQRVAQWGPSKGDSAQRPWPGGTLHTQAHCPAWFRKDSAPGYNLGG